VIRLWSANTRRVAVSAGTEPWTFPEAPLPLEAATHNLLAFTAFPRQS